MSNQIIIMQKGKGKPAVKLSRDQLEQKIDSCCDVLKDLSMDGITQKTIGSSGRKPCRRFMD